MQNLFEKFVKNIEKTLGSSVNLSPGFVCDKM